MNRKIELIKEIYQIQDDDLEKRQEALEKILPFVNGIMDKFYEKLLEKDDFSKFIPKDRIEELKKKQIDFVAALLSEPFDESLYKKIAHVGIAHYHIKLDPISMSYGYHLLSTLILEQSKKDPSLLPYLKLIIKYLKVAEAIMGEEYFAQKSLSESPYRANNLFIAVNELHMAYIHCKTSFEKREIDEDAKDAFYNSLDNLKIYRNILSEAGFNLSTIKRYCTEFSNEKSDKSLKALKNSILNPMNNLSVTAYLSLASSLALLQSLTDIVYHRSVTNEKELTLEKIQQNIQKILGENFGWALENMDIRSTEPEEGYEIVKHISYKDNIFYLCINIRNVMNKLYILEGIDLLAETMKLTIFLLAKDS